MRHDRPRWRRVVRVRLHRSLSRLDRSAPAWLTWLPSWGTSVLFHGVALVVLATFMFVSGREGERDDFDTAIISLADQDITSLVPADRSGDPFTDLKSDQMPSITLDPSGTDSSQPDMDEALKLASRSSASKGNRADSTGLSDDLLAPGAHFEPKTATFSGRKGASRTQLVRREGGTTASEKAVQEGLNWLMRHQRADGGWNLDVRGECRKGSACPEDAHAVSETAATGLALLPFLGAGHIHDQPSRYRDQVARGIDWLIAHQQKAGELFVGGGDNHQMYSHAIASMALCEAYGISRDSRLKEPAQRAVDFIARAQNKEDGGWRYTPGMAGDTSVFGWQMLALRSAGLSGLDIPKDVIKGCVTYLNRAGTDKSFTHYAYQPGGSASPTMTAEGLLCRQYLGWRRDNPALVAGVEGVWDNLRSSSDRNIYYWYYATQLLHNMHNDAWKQWNPKVRDTLVTSQIITKGCDHGSWSPVLPQADALGTRVGRLYQTSLSILTLEVYYRFLPLYRSDDRRAEAPPNP